MVKISGPILNKTDFLHYLTLSLFISMYMKRSVLFYLKKEYLLFLFILTSNHCVEFTVLKYVSILFRNWFHLFKVFILRKKKMGERNKQTCINLMYNICMHIRKCECVCICLIFILLFFIFLNDFSLILFGLPTLLAC